MSNTQNNVFDVYNDKVCNNANFEFTGRKHSVLRKAQTQRCPWWLPKRRDLQTKSDEFDVPRQTILTSEPDRIS